MVNQANLISIEVAYADSQQQFVLNLTVPADSTVKQVLELAQQDPRFSNIDLSQYNVGIFSEIVSRDTVLKEGDRLEIYLPLRIDPKQRRKLRAETD